MTVDPKPLHQLDELPTPSLLLRRDVLDRNCQAMKKRADELGVALRPHMKTAKSGIVARLAATDQVGGITVSTLAEAVYFFDEGFRDMTYAVGITPQKLPAVAALMARGAQLSLLTDNLGVIDLLSAKAEEIGGDVTFTLLIEIDSGGRRGGVSLEGSDLLALGQAITMAPGLKLGGVLVHAGHSYGCETIEQIQKVAEEERAAAVMAAACLRNEGLTCDVVSVGSTPTAVHAKSLEGVTEMRPGVYVLGDLAQVDLGSLCHDDLAVAVWATVVGHNRQADRILIDAGGLALSKDQSAARRTENLGYGLLCAPDGDRGFTLREDRLYVADVHQEHGLVAAPPGLELPYADLPVGARVAVLPNHVCMTAAAHGGYHVIDAQGRVEDYWPRCTGW